MIVPKIQVSELTLMKQFFLKTFGVVQQKALKKTLLLECRNNLIRIYTVTAKKCNIYSLYIRLHLCIMYSSVPCKAVSIRSTPYKFTSYTLTSKKRLWYTIWRNIMIRKLDFFSENCFKKRSISFNSVPNQKSKCSKNKIKVQL